MEKKIERKVDAIVVGAGPAGLSASIYLGRDKFRNVILTGDVGGQTAVSGEIENFPGYLKISGIELINTMQKQAKKWGAEIIMTEPVLKIEKVGDYFEVEAEDGHVYQAKGVIITSGKKYRKLEIPGEEELTAKGVSYCATCDGAFFKGKKVALVGGANSAVKAMLQIAPTVKKIYSININSDLMGEGVLLDKVKKLHNVEFFKNTKALEIIGRDRVNALRIKKDDGKEEILKVDGVFIEIGSFPNTGYLKNVCALNEKGEIIVDKKNMTSLPGLFAGGDVTDVTAKQTVIAASEGAKAAIHLASFLRSGNL